MSAEHPINKELILYMLKMARYLLESHDLCKDVVARDKDGNEADITNPDTVTNLSVTGALVMSMSVALQKGFGDDYHDLPIDIKMYIVALLHQLLSKRVPTPIEGSLVSFQSYSNREDVTKEEVIEVFCTTIEEIEEEDDDVRYYLKKDPEEIFEAVESAPNTLLN